MKFRRRWELYPVRKDLEIRRVGMMKIISISHYSRNMMISNKAQGIKNSNENKL